MATKDIGARIAVDGESDYRQAIKQIAQEQKALNAEMKLSVAQFKNDGDEKKKNAKQTELLSKEIKNQEKYIGTLKGQLEKASAEYGENSTQALKLREQVAKAETALETMNNQLNEVGGSSKTFRENLQDVQDNLKDVGGTLKDVGGKMSKSVTAPIVAFGTAAVASFKEVDNAEDIIIQKTGATGKALDGMTGSMKNLATSIPTTSFEEAGTAIGEVNTRFALTGDALEDLSGQFIKFSKLNGTDVNASIDGTSKVLQAFNLDASDTSKVLDAMNSTGQATGISMDLLQSSLLSNASTFRSLGFTISDSIELLGTLETSGVDAGTVLGGLSKAQKTAIQDGRDMSDVLTEAFSSSDAAIDTFGKSGAKLFEMFQSGQLTIDMFTASGTSLDETIGSVSDTFNATLDPLDQWGVTLNQLKATGAELGSSIGAVLAPMLSKVADAAKMAGEWFNSLSDDQKQTIVTIGMVVAAIGPAIAILGGLVTAIAAIMSPVGLVVAAVVAAGVTIGVVAGTIVKHWDSIKQGASNLLNGITTTFNNIKKAIVDKINAARDAVHNAIEKIKSFFNFSWSLPKLKMPHITISGEFSLVPPRVPKFGIEWFGKGYSSIYKFDSPTVIPTLSGFKGFGDRAGSELVMGENIFKQAIAGASKGNTVINITVYPSEGMDEEGLAERVAEKLQDFVDRDEEVFA